MAAPIVTALPVAVTPSLKSDGELFNPYRVECKKVASIYLRLRMGTLSGNCSDLDDMVCACA